MVNFRLLKNTLRTDHLSQEIFSHYLDDKVLKQHQNVNFWSVGPPLGIHKFHLINAHNTLNNINPKTMHIWRILWCQKYPLEWQSCPEHILSNIIPIWRISGCQNTLETDHLAQDIDTHWLDNKSTETTPKCRFSIC